MRFLCDKPLLWQQLQICPWQLELPTDRPESCRQKVTSRMCPTVLLAHTCPAHTRSYFIARTFLTQGGCEQLFSEQTRLGTAAAMLRDVWHRIQNMGRSYSVVPVHQVRTVGLIKGAFKQTMKALTIFDDYISLKQVIGYMCTTKSEQWAKKSGILWIYGAFKTTGNAGKKLSWIMMMSVIFRS